jgi:nicotinic acid phosphoribosyltransferase
MDLIERIDILDIQQLCDFLKNSGISDAAIEVLEEEEIGGEEFLDLTEENFMKTNIKLGQVKKLLKIQAQYKPKLPQVSVQQYCTSTRLIPRMHII